MKTVAPPIWLLACTFPLAAVLMAWIATLLRQQRGEPTQAAWLGAATAAALAYEVLALACLGVLRSQAHSTLGERLRAKGIDPVRLVGLSGMSILLCPACLAMFLFFFGLPLSQLYVAVAFSVLGTLYWPFVYRRAAPAA